MKQYIMNTKKNLTKKKAIALRDICQLALDRGGLSPEFRVITMRDMQVFQARIDEIERQEAERAFASAFTPNRYGEYM